MQTPTLSASEYRTFRYAVASGYYRTDDERAIWRMRAVLRGLVDGGQFENEDAARRILDEHYQAKRIVERWQLRQRQHTGD